MSNEQHELNRRSWNAATVAHNSHKVDQAAFFADGGNTLRPEEIGLLGDVSGQRVVHLQCNAGQDSLSLASKLGAKVVGVDISDTAIDAATALSVESGIPARFVRADVYDFLDDPAEHGQYDVVFASYGALCWLSDLPRWARGVAELLRPGGRVVVMEFHPFMMMFDEKLRLRYAYFHGQGQHDDEGINDYVAMSGPAMTPMGFDAGVTDFTNPHACVEWSWGVGDLVSALVGAGMAIERLKEWPYVNLWKGFDEMVELGDGRLGLPEGMPSMPLMLGVVARRA